MITGCAFGLINKLAAGRPAWMRQVSTMHITIAWRNHTFHLNEMLLLWKQWIDGNAAPRSVSLQGCVFVRHGRQEHVSLPPSGERRPSCSIIFFHLAVITLCHWQLKKWRKRKNKGTMRPFSACVCTHYRSTAVFKATSRRSANLWCFNVMQLFISLPEGAPSAFNKHDRYWGVWNYWERSSVIWQ